MSTAPDQDRAHTTKLCSVCGSSGLETIAELPALPITGRFSSRPPRALPPGIDQAFLWCPGCGQGQLATPVGADDLYGSAYSFRTSESATARAGAAFFFDVLDAVAGGARFGTVVDVGCNDTFHLERLSGRANRRVGIDPIWAGRESEAPPGIEVIGTTVEAADLESRLQGPPDLIISTHTFEHIPEPASVLGALMDIAGPDTLFLIETPGLDAMVRRHRFDQVFHEHLQYYSAASYSHLLDRVGAEILAIRENYHHWGALVVAFKKRTGPSDRRPAPAAWTAGGIRDRYALFRETCGTAGRTLETLDGDVYGYGAAQLLPGLAYHMGTDFGGLRAVLDDDPAKDGLYYWNLPVPIASPERFPSWRDGTVVVTALDNVHPITQKLLERRPRHVVYPLHIL